MPEFESSASITVELDQSSLRDARDEIEDELATDPITVDSTMDSGAAMTDGGVGGDVMTELSQQTDYLEAIHDELEQGAGGGGGGGIGALDVLGLSRLGNLAAGGVVGTLLARAGSMIPSAPIPSAPGVGMPSGPGVPIGLSPEIIRRGLKNVFGIDLIADLNKMFGHGGGGTRTVLGGAAMSNLGKQLGPIEFGELPGWEWPTIPVDNLWSWPNIDTSELWGWPGIDTGELWDWPSVDTKKLWDWPGIDTGTLWDWPGIDTGELWDWPSVQTGELWDWPTVPSGKLWDWPDVPSGQLWDWPEIPRPDWLSELPGVNGNKNGTNTDLPPGYDPPAPGEVGRFPQMPSRSTEKENNKSGLRTSKSATTGTASTSRRGGGRSGAIDVTVEVDMADLRQLDRKLDRAAKEIKREIERELGRDFGPEL